jgi:hypothetical protein
LIWEYRGEIHRPSLNDFISTTVGGVALGELTWQLSGLVLDNQATGSSRFWKEMTGMGINPARGFNQLFFHDWSRVGPNPASRTPELMRGSMRAGARLVDQGGGIDKGALQPFVGFDFVHRGPFTQPYTKSVDVVLFSAQLNTGDASFIGRLSTYGRLYSKRLDSRPEPRHVLILTQDYDYVNTFAYRVDCENCESIERFWSGSGYLRAGATLGEHVRVGGELVFWQKSLEGSDAYLRAIEGVVLWHPSPPGGCFGQAGLGLGRIRNVFTTAGTTVRASETGLSVMVGVGYDLRVGNRIFLTPSLMSVAVPAATIDTPAGPLENMVATLFFAGLGVTIR